MTWLWILIAFIVGAVFGMLMCAVLIANGDDGPVRGDGYREEDDYDRQRKDS